MSDIGLHFDGLLALLAILAVDAALLLGFAVCLTLGWIRARRAKVSICSQPIHRHIAGMLACALVINGIGLVIFLYGLKASPSPLEAWLDRWVILWLPAIFLLWPVSAAGVKRRQGRIIPTGTAPTGCG